MARALTSALAAYRSRRAAASHSRHHVRALPVPALMENASKGLLSLQRGQRLSSATDLTVGRYRSSVLLLLIAGVDLCLAGWLLWTVPRSHRNRESVITVASVLVGCSGLLGVLALT